MSEERRQAAADRQTLLSQITDLINKSGEAQEVRLQAKIDSVREDVASSKIALQKADQQHMEGMRLWSEKENLLVDEVLKSRDTLKGKMKNDWTVSTTGVKSSSRNAEC